MLNHTLDTIEHRTADLEGLKVIKHIRDICDQYNFAFADRFNYQRPGPDLSKTPQRKLLGIYIKDLIVGYSHWENLNQQLQQYDKQLVMCTDSIVEFPKLSNIRFFFHPSLIGMKHFFVDPNWYNYLPSRPPSRLYNCFIHRANSIRQTWFYFLHEHNLLDQGYVSYLLYHNAPSTIDPKSELSDQEYFEYLTANKNYFTELHNKYDLGKIEHFERAYQELLPRVPYQNFEENRILADKMMDSKYSLVLDTDAVEDDQDRWFFSEKVARALMLPTIDLSFVQKGALAKLKSFGLISNSTNLGIDQLSWPERQTKLLEILVQDEFDYNFNQLKEIGQHNHNIFQQLYNTIDDFYTETIDIMHSTLD